jgi:hypothetical protein
MGDQYFRMGDQYFRVPNDIMDQTNEGEPMGRRHTASAVVPLGVRRRSTLAFLGFRYDGRQGVWRRAELTLTDDTLDRLSERSFGQLVRHWRQARHDR